MNRLTLLALLAVPILAACGPKPQPAAARPIAPPPDSAPVAGAAPAPSAETTPAPAPTAPQPSATTVVPFATPEGLADYNRRLHAWVERTSYLPKRLEELHTLAGDCPRPPKAPPGQRLVFDPKTVSVRLE